MVPIVTNIIITTAPITILIVNTMELTAGRAKNDIAKTEKHEATILPIHVWGTVSP